LQFDGLTPAGQPEGSSQSAVFKDCRVRCHFGAVEHGPEIAQGLAGGTGVWCPGKKSGINIRLVRPMCELKTDRSLRRKERSEVQQLNGQC